VCAIRSSGFTEMGAHRAGTWAAPPTVAVTT
jgi:hypothetical protein